MPIVIIKNLVSFSQSGGVNLKLAYGSHLTQHSIITAKLRGMPSFHVSGKKAAEKKPIVKLPR